MYGLVFSWAGVSWVSAGEGGGADSADATGSTGDGADPEGEGGVPAGAGAAGGGGGGAAAGDGSAADGSRSAAARSSSAATSGTVRSPRSLVHISISVPPAEAATSPIGTPSAWCSARPKCQHTAENARTVSADAGCQRPRHVACGVSAIARPTVKRRIGAPAGTSIAASGANCSTVCSMFDCPEQSHVSPT